MVISKPTKTNNTFARFCVASGYVIKATIYQEFINAIYSSVALRQLQKTE